MLPIVKTIQAYADLGLSSLEVLFFPIDEATSMAESEVPFVSTVTKVISGVGIISIIVSMITWYEENFDEHWAIKWILIPLLILDFMLVALLLGLVGFGPGKLQSAGQWIVKYVLPVIYTLGGGALIAGMIIMPKQVLNTSRIGQTIYYLPGILGYAPINKHPFYAIVILIRTGGIITQVAGGTIELASGEES